MKILMLIDSLDTGGAETHVLILSSHLKKKGCEIVIASEGGNLVENFKKNGIKHINLPSFNTIWEEKNGQRERKNSISPLLDFLSTQRNLKKIIEYERPHIVHAHTRKTAFLARVICKRANIPLICTAHAMFSMEIIKNSLSHWGDGTIAVSEDIALHLKKNAVFKPQQTKVIRNGVEIPQKPLVEI